MAQTDLRTATAAQLEARDARVLADCMKVRFFPLVIDRQQGNRMYDDAGREYLDLTSGWSVASTGYGHPKVIEAVTRQFQRTTFASTLSALAEPAIELGERLVALAPGDFEKKVWYGLSGSDANETLGKMVPLATGKPKMVTFIGGYHGMTGAAAAMTGHGTTARLRADGNVIKIPFPDPYRPVFGTSPETVAQAVLDYLENYLFRTILPPELVGGILVEAVQADSGDVVPPKGFLKGLEQVCRRHNILLMLDEVKIGMGRTGRFFGFEHEGVTPDLIALGKALGGGIPLSAVIGRKEILDAATAVNMYSTAGNPVAAAAALAVLDVTEEEGLAQNAADVGAYLLEGLKGLQSRHYLIGHVRGLGCILGLELVRDRDTKEPASREAAKLSYSCYEHGLLLYYAGLYSNVMEFTPPLTLSRADVDEAIDKLDRALTEVESGRFTDDRLGNYVGW